MRHVVVALVVVLAGAAHAGSDEARELYRQGMAHYDAGDYPAAIAEFERAYQLSHAPRLLFDIAQAQRLAGRDDEALQSYASYLKLEPDAPNRAEVAARIAELGRVLHERRPSQPAQMTPATVTAPAPAASRSLIIAGAVVGAVGLALVGGAIAATVVAANDGAQMSAGKPMGPPGNMRNAALADDQRRNQIASAVLWSVGGAALVAGGVTALVGARRASVRVGAIASPSGASVSLSGELP